MRSPCKRVLRSQVRRSRCHRLILALLATTTSPMARAQGTIYLSHLGTATDAGAPVASDSWWGTFFETGPVAGGYSLDSIQLRIAGISGNPGGFDLSLYSNNGGDPGASLGLLRGSAPTAAGIYSYSAAGITLAPATEYWVVATSPDPRASGNTVSWAYDSAAYASTGGWSLSTTYFASSPDGTYWENVFGAGGNPFFTLAVTATPAPEPEIAPLTGLGMLAFAWARARKCRENPHSSAAA